VVPQFLPSVPIGAEGFVVEKIKGDARMNIYDELVARGLIAQVTDETEIKGLVNAGKATFYIGFDPTADSLHVGHFMALCLMRRLQLAGNRPVVLLGGGTGMVGDPSGRTDMRSMLTPETIQHNCDRFKKQMEHFIEFGDGKAIMVNNADWLLKLNYVELLREVGACFSVNNMLRADCYKQRMEKGLSFLEFNYMIMQAYDFYYLFQHHGCNMQFGGDDQWSNMLGGTELIRRKLGENAYAMTITLLMNSEGNKMGKTAKGAVWLDPEKTSPFDFYQYWRNVDDADVLKCIRMLTFLPLEQIDAMDQWEGSELNQAKEILAYELTMLIHGEAEAEKAKGAAMALFAGGSDDSNMPATQISPDQLTDEVMGIMDLLVTCGLAASKSEARRLVQQGGVFLDEAKVDSIDLKVTAQELTAGVKLRKGKKTYHRAMIVQ
jgi:tyrosyl-tRNA synthetase